MSTQIDCLRKLLLPASSRRQMASLDALVEFGQADGDVVFSFQALEELINGAELALKERGVSKGDRVILISPNSAVLAATILAAWRLSAISIPLDFRLTPNELDNVVARLNAAVLCGSTAHNPAFLTQHAALGDKGIGMVDLSTIKPTATDQQIVERTERSIEERDFDQSALVILTSGTTGVPKGALHDLGTLMVNLKELGELVGLTEDKRCLLPLPLSHIFGLEVTLICQIFGASVIFTDLSPNGFFNAMAKYAPHVLVGVPTIYGAMLGLPREKVALDNAEVLLSGGAPLPVSLADQFQAAFGKKINNGYGSTESKIIALNLDGPNESIGKPVASVKVSIVDENDRPLEEGETGEIRIDGPILMQGYIDQPEATERVLHQMHYHTGDIGYIKDGYVFISGRAKEMIIVAGNKVFPVEVEGVLRQNQNVKEVAVVGVPHSKLGQIVKAIIVLKEGRLSDQLKGTTEMRKEARQELLAAFKEYSRETLKRELRPMDWEFRPDTEPLPKTMSGKVDKKSLEAVAL